MKDFMKKKMYLILLVVSFSSLFSAILYADPIYCEKDSDCPPGMICVIPGNFCMVPAVSNCTQTPQFYEIAYCYSEYTTTEDGVPMIKCKWEGVEAITCIMRYL